MKKLAVLLSLFMLTIACPTHSFEPNGLDAELWDEASGQTSDAYTSQDFWQATAPVYDSAVAAYESASDAYKSAADAYNAASEKYNEYAEQYPLWQDSSYFSTPIPQRTYQLYYRGLPVAVVPATAADDLLVSYLYDAGQHANRLGAAAKDISPEHAKKITLASGFTIGVMATKLGYILKRSSARSKTVAVSLATAAAVKAIPSVTERYQQVKQRRERYEKVYELADKIKSEIGSLKGKISSQISSLWQSKSLPQDLPQT